MVEPLVNQSKITLSISGAEGFREIYENGGIIGRLADSAVHINDQTVSRKHAEIFYDKEKKKFFIRNLSEQGTYMHLIEYNFKSQEKIEDDLIFRLGAEDTFIQIKKVFQHASAPNMWEVKLELFSGDTAMKREVFEFLLDSERNEKITIGKDESNMVRTPPQDSAVSRRHCMIGFNRQDNQDAKSCQLVLKDLDSANGTFFMLDISKPHEIFTYDQYYPGESDNFVKVESINIGGELKIEEQQLCVICTERPPKVVFTPCGHQSICIDCLNLNKKQFQNCPICRVKVEDQIIQK